MTDPIVQTNTLVQPWIEQRLLGREHSMQAALASVRGETSHATTVGTRAEKEVRTQLRAHLPASLRIGHGVIHDSFGNVSKQCDVVITNADHPFTSHEPEDADSYFVEGVSAVAEVKANLGSKDLHECVNAGSQLKSLHPMYNPSTDGVTHSTPYLESTNGLPPYVVIAFDSSFRLPTLLDKLRAVDPVPVPEYKLAKGVKEQPPIDAVCVLGKFIAWNLRDVDGPFKLRGDNGEPLRGWIGIETQAPLAWTLVWLQLYMPRVVRETPILQWYLGERMWVTQTEPAAADGQRGQRPAAR